MTLTLRLLALSLFSSLLVLTAAPNLLNNGSFELPIIDGKMPGWSFPAENSRLAADASDGEKSLQFNGVIGQWNLSLPEGVYELKLSLKKDCTNVLGVRLICYNAANQEIPGAGVSFYVAEGKRLGVWTEFQRVAKVPAEARRSALVFHTHSGIMLLDNIRLSEARPNDDGELVFSDDFSGSQLGAEWKIVSGQWQLLDGELFAPVNYKEAVLKFNGKIGRNLRLEYDCRSAAPNDLSAILACHPDTEKKEGYVFGFGASYNSYNYIAKGNPFAILTRTIQEGFNTGIMPGKTHHVIVEKRDGMLKFYRDGQLELSTDDLFSDEEDGESFALLTYNLGYYDNIKVYRLPDNPRKRQAAEVKVEKIEVYDFSTSAEPLTHDGRRIEVPTWDYDATPRQAQITVNDPCLECSNALFALPELSSGIIEFDLFTATAQEVQISLETEAGALAGALLIGKDGIFLAEGASGTVQLSDKIEYRRRLLYDTLAFVPGQWHTFRIKYDLENQIIDNLALIDLYTEIKGGYDKDAQINQGNYISLGGRIPLKKHDGAVSRLRFKTSGEAKLLLDNVLLFGPVGFKTVNGRNILFPGHVLLPVSLQLRRDPMTLKRQSLRHFTRKDYAYRTPVMNEYRLGGGKQSFQLWAREYNEIMLRSALLREKLSLLQRQEFYHGNEAKISSLAEFWRQFANLEQQQEKTVQAFAAAFWADCDDGLLAGPARQELSIFTTLLHTLEEKTSAWFTQKPIPSQDIYSDWNFDYDAAQKRWFRNGQVEAFFFSKNCGKGSEVENLPSTFDKLRALGFQPAVADFGWLEGGSPKDGEFFSQEGFDKAVAHSREIIRQHKIAPYSSAWLQYGTGQIRFPVPLWWLEAHQDDPDIFHHKPDGSSGREATPIYRGWPRFPFLTLNFWNPTVSSYLADRMRLVGEAMKEHEDVFANTIFHLGGEATISLPGGMYLGYAPSAVQAFQQHLKDKYGGIEQLNRAWGSKHTDFADIKPPPPGSAPSPLRYEFQTFVHADYFNHFIRIGKENLESGFGRSLPIGHDFQDSFSEFDMPAFYDNTSIVLFHSYQIWDRKVYPKYLQSLAQATGTPWGAMEWSASEGSKTMFDLEEIRLHAIREISHQLQWGCVAPNLFSDFLARPSDWQYGMPLTDYRVGHLLFDYHASFYRVCKERAVRLGNIALSGQLLPPDVAVLEVDSSRRNALPDRAIYAMCKDFSMEMEKQNAHYGFFYEKLLLDGRQRLNETPLLFVPNGICMPEKLELLLLDYLQQGGIVIAFAPPGVFNELGLPGAKHLLQKAFPDALWQHRGYAHWQTDKYASETLCGTQVYKGKVGKGQLYVFPSPNNFERARAAFLHLLQEYVNPRIRSEQPEYQFSLWEKDDARYLYVLNYDIKQRRDGKLSVLGKYRVEDLDLPGRKDIAVSYNNGRSEFSTSLAAAEMTLFRLIPVP